MKYLKLFEQFTKLNDNFYKWFGNSKVVDKRGKPMVMYHGSPHLDQIKKDGKFINKNIVFLLF
jgi:hypothetical protein